MSNIEHKQPPTTYRNMSHENTQEQDVASRQPPPPYSQPSSEKKLTPWKKLCRGFTHTRDMRDKRRNVYGWQTRNLPSPRPPSYPLFNYCIDSRHYPPKQQTAETWKDSPWSAEMRLGCNSLEQILPQHLDWRNNYDMCSADEIELEADAQLPGYRTFTRTIIWSWGGKDPECFSAWQLEVHIHSRDAQWLANLRRADLGTFIDIESAVR